MKCLSNNWDKLLFFQCELKYLWLWSIQVSLNNILDTVCTSTTHYIHAVYRELYFPSIYHFYNVCFPHKCDKLQWLSHKVGSVLQLFVVRVFNSSGSNIIRNTSPMSYVAVQSLICIYV